MDNTGATRFRVNGATAPFNPILVRIIHPRDPHLRDADDLQRISAMLDVPPETASALIDEIHAFSHSHVRNLRFIRSAERYPPGKTTNVPPINFSNCFLSEMWMGQFRIFPWLR